MNKTLISLLLLASASAQAIAPRDVSLKGVASGVVAVKTNKGFYIKKAVPTLRSASAVVQGAAEAGGVPVHILYQTAVDAPFAPKGFQGQGNNYSRNPAHALSRSEFAWQAGFGSRSVSVAVLDQVFPEFHPALASSYDKTNAYDVRNNDSNPWMTTFDLDPTFGTPKIHGVNVTGIVASDWTALTGADRAAGIAPGVSIMPINICCFVDDFGVENRRAADSVVVANAILYAARLTNSTGRLPTRRADVITLSYDIFAGGAQFDQAIADAITSAVNNGVLFVTGTSDTARSSGVVASENSVSALPGVIVVSGSDIRAGQISASSTVGSAVDVSAEFNHVTTNVELASGALRYTAADVAGVSYSAPFVAGLYALAKSTYPALTPAIFQSWINSDTVTFPNEYLAGYDTVSSGPVTRTGARDDDFGYGIIDAKRLINRALGAQGLSQIGSLPAIPTPTIAVQSSTDSFVVRFTASNPYAASSMLGYLTYDIQWTPLAAGPAPVLTGRSKLDGATDLCVDGGEGSPNVGASDLALFGLMIPGNGSRTCGYKLSFNRNGYNGRFKVDFQPSSLFAGAGSGSQTFNVGVIPAVSGVTLTSNKSTTPVGTVIRLTWGSTNADSCAASGAWSGALATSGFRDVTTSSTAGTATYGITCSNSKPSSVSATTSVTLTPVINPVSGVSLSSSAANANTGSVVRLTWASTDADSCTATGAWSGALAVDGFRDVTVPGTPGSVTYGITCSNAKPSNASASTSVNVQQPAVSGVTISSSASSAVASSVVRLTWNSVNANSCTASGSWSGAIATSGTRDVTLPATAGTASYAINCSNARPSSASASTSVTVTAPPPPPPSVSNVTIMSNVSSAFLGATIRLSWNSVSATACTASGGWSGSLAASGFRDVVVPATKGAISYTVTCTNNTPSNAAASASVTVYGDTNADFAMNSRSSTSTGRAEVGQPVTITWNAQNAVNCSASGASDFSGSKAAAGSVTVTPRAAGQASYRLDCANPVNSAARIVTFTVDPAPAGAEGGGGSGGLLAMVLGLVAIGRRWKFC